LKTISFFILSLIIFSESVAQLNEISLYTPNNVHLNSRVYVSLPEEEKPDFVFPVVYSLSIMTVNIAGLILSGHANNPPSFHQFKQAYIAPPVFDKDHWAVNYVAHPLMGSETYLRARENHFGPFGSFLFSTGASLTWEYLIESWTEPPSIQDMLVTSTTGSILGELRYQAKQKMNPKHHWIIDPIYTAYIAVFKRDKNMTACSFGMVIHIK
jgi:hypothetical protein